MSKDEDQIRGCVEAYSLAGKGLAIEQHMQACANIMANIALAIYLNRTSKGFNEAGSKELAKATLKSLMSGAERVLEERIAGEQGTVVLRRKP